MATPEQIAPGTDRIRVVRDYLDAAHGYIQMAFLPPYAPDLNPVSNPSATL